MQDTAESLMKEIRDALAFLNPTKPINFGTQATIMVEPGTQETIEIFNEEEMKIWARDWYFIKQQWTEYTIDVEQRHCLADMLETHKLTCLLGGFLAKAKIDPKPGGFDGIEPKSGFGFSRIRPDYVHPAGQGRTFDYTLAGAANTWYGVLHNAAIGAAVNDSLFMRKAVFAVVVGYADTGGNPTFDEFQFTDLGGQDRVVIPATEWMRMTNMAFVQFARAAMLRSSKPYRFEAKSNAAAGSGCLIPIGVAYADFDTMKNQQPTVPTNAAP